MDKYWDIIHSEMIELVSIITKYSREQLANMLVGVDFNALYDDMVKNGATRDELRSMAECIHDISTANQID